MTEERRKTLTVEEAAEYLRVHPETVRRLARAKKLRGVKTGVGRGGTWRFRPEDLDAIFEENET